MAPTAGGGPRPLALGTCTSSSSCTRVGRETASVKCGLSSHVPRLAALGQPPAVVPSHAPAQVSACQSSPGSMGAMDQSAADGAPPACSAAYAQSEKLSGGSSAAVGAPSASQYGTSTYPNAPLVGASSTSAAAPAQMSETTASDVLRMSEGASATLRCVPAIARSSAQPTRAPASPPRRSGCAPAGASLMTRRVGCATESRYCGLSRHDGRSREPPRHCASQRPGRTAAAQPFPPSGRPSTSSENRPTKSANAIQKIPSAPASPPPPSSPPAPAKGTGKRVRGARVAASVLPPSTGAAQPAASESAYDPRHSSRPKRLRRQTSCSPPTVCASSSV